MALQLATVIVGGIAALAWPAVGLYFLLIVRDALRK